MLVPATTPGLTVAPMQTVDLTRRFDIVTFDDVRVPAAAVVGTAGEAAADVHRQFELLIVLLNAESVGAMQAAFDMTVEWAFDRYSFGRPLASYQALKHRFADMYHVAPVEPRHQRRRLRRRRRGRPRRAPSWSARPRPTSASTAPSWCRTARRCTGASASRSSTTCTCSCGGSR